MLEASSKASPRICFVLNLILQLMPHIPFALKLSIGLVLPRRPVKSRETSMQLAKEPACVCSMCIVVYLLSGVQLHSYTFLSRFFFVEHLTHSSKAQPTTSPKLCPETDIAYLMPFGWMTSKPTRTQILHKCTTSCCCTLVACSAALIFQRRAGASSPHHLQSPTPMAIISDRARPCISSIEHRITELVSAIA